MNIQNETSEMISKGFKENVDNMVLQGILKMLKAVKLKDEQLISIKLDCCPFNGKQRIYIENSEDAEYDIEKCVFCEKPVDNRVIVYKFNNNEESTTIICLEDEAEELIKK